jgi:hypothetical protein
MLKSIHESEPQVKLGECTLAYIYDLFKVHAWVTLIEPLSCGPHPSLPIVSTQKVSWSLESKGHMK